MKNSNRGVSAIKPTEDNGQLPLGDAHEADGGDTTFDPAALEAKPAAQDDGPDPFDPAALRLSQDGMAKVAVKREQLTVAVRKPDKSWWVRAHPDDAYHLQTAVIELKENREVYLIAPPLVPDLTTEATFRYKLLTTAINRQGDLFLWETNLPQAGEKSNSWTTSALEAVSRARKDWVRVVARISAGGYELGTARGQLPDTEWPDMTFAQILRTAFRDYYISSHDHPVLRQLRGES